MRGFYRAMKAGAVKMNTERNPGSTKSSTTFDKFKTPYDVTCLAGNRSGLCLEPRTGIGAEHDRLVRPQAGRCSSTRATARRRAGGGTSENEAENAAPPSLESVIGRKPRSRN